MRLSQVHLPGCSKPSGQCPRSHIASFWEFATPLPKAVLDLSIWIWFLDSFECWCNQHFYLSTHSL